MSATEPNTSIYSVGKTCDTKKDQLERIAEALENMGNFVDKIEENGNVTGRVVNPSPDGYSGYEAETRGGGSFKFLTGDLSDFYPDGFYRTYFETQGNLFWRNFGDLLLNVSGKAELTTEETLFLRGKVETIIGHDKDSLIGFFNAGNKSAQYPNVALLPNDASLSDVIARLNETTTLLRNFGFIADATQL